MSASSLMPASFRSPPSLRILPLLLGILSIALFPGPYSEAQERDFLLNPELRELLHEELSGEWAKEQVIHISRHSRVQGSRGYRDAANYVLGQLRNIGLSEADSYIESFPSDLRATYQTWISPSGWDIEAAELRMVEPRDELITRWTDLPISVMTYSNAGEATAEVLWVGRGDSPSDYDGVDVEGKIVLCTGYGGDVHRLAVLEHDALAVACYLDDERSRRHPDLVRYTGMWPRPGEEEDTTFGFNLSRRQGEALRELLAAGERVVLHGEVKGRGLEPYFMDTPVAWIRGSTQPEEVLVFSAHLDHPKESANDNASGSGALLDMARTLHDLIKSGRMERPKRSILFLWVPEFYGTMAYIDAHPEMVGRPMGGDYLGNINLDMVGEHLELLHSTMMIRSTPTSNPSVLNDVVAHMTSSLDQLDIRISRGSRSAHNFRVTEYSGGSDHMMFNALHIPGLMINHTDWAHHTSEDTPEKVDPVQLQRSEMIALSSFLYLSDLTDKEAIDLAWYAGANRAERLAQAGHQAHRRLRAVTAEELRREWAEVENMLRHALRWEQDAVATILNFRDTSKVRDAVIGVQERLSDQHRQLVSHIRSEISTRGVGDVEPPRLEARPDDRVPHRLTRGPLQSSNPSVPERDLPEKRASWYASDANPLSSMHRMEIVNFMDGERTISDIRHAVSAAYGPVPTAAVARFVNDLVAVGVVTVR